jgi:hypothetical protein
MNKSLLVVAGIITIGVGMYILGEHIGEEEVKKAFSETFESDDNFSFEESV